MKTEKDKMKPTEPSKRIIGYVAQYEVTKGYHCGMRVYDTEKRALRYYPLGPILPVYVELPNEKA